MSELRKILFQRQEDFTRISGELHLPAVPALAEEFTAKCCELFATMNRAFSSEDRERFRSILERVMNEAFAASHRSSVRVSYETGFLRPISYTITGNSQTIDKAYEGWTEVCGTQPDARPRVIAANTPDPEQYRVLDIGAGTGRNALAFARRGHPVDAVELTKTFADKIRAEAQRESLDVRVIDGDLFDANVNLRRDYAMVLVAGVVHELRSVEQLRGLFEIAARSLRPEGHLVLDLFLTYPDYTPDEVARQCAQQSFSTFFTRGDLSTVSAGLPLQLISDEGAPQYEQEHQPDGTWPPTPYYANWAAGRDLFGLRCTEIPIELRWLVYRKTI